MFDAACLGSSLSLRGNLRLGASLSVNSHIAVALSVCEISSIGSTLSVRSFVRLGSSLSVLGSCRLASTLSVVDAVHLGSSLSLRGCARVGKALSIVGFSNLGSSLSLRSLARLGSSVSLFGGARFGSSLSVLDFLMLGSTLSIRGCTRLGSGLSVQDEAQIGAVSVCGLAKFTSTVSVQEVIRLGKETTYIKTDWQVGYDGGFGYVFDTVEVWAGTSNDPTPKRGIGTWGNGGHLHGTWTADNAVSTSDRRLKKSIIPLYEAMKGQGQSEEAEGVSWVLRQLRPVSFKFKNGPEAKYSRYGFIAQELQEVLPSVVRSVQTDGREHLAVAYQDLIALLTSAAQILQEKVSKQEDKITRLEDQLAALNKKLDLLLETRTQEFLA